MSRSSTYRPISLTPEQRAEIARQERVRRFRDEMLPHLREHVSQQLLNLDGKGALLNERGDSWHQQIMAASTVEHLRSLSVEISTRDRQTAGRTIQQSGRVTPTLAGASDPLLPEGTDELLERSRTPRLMRPGMDRTSPFQGLPSQPGLSTQSDDDVEVRCAELRFEVSHLRSELESLQGTARELRVELADSSGVHELISRGEVALDNRDPDGAGEELAQAWPSVDAMDRMVDEALVAAECRSRTTETVRGALDAMGFTVVDSVTEGTDTFMVARTSDGREAEVALSGGGSTSGCNASFTDPYDAVAADHPEADSPCMSAASDAVEFHRYIDGTDSIEAGEITALERPTRSSVPGSTDQPVRRTRTNNTQHRRTR